jgi:hypothetical protein
VNGEGIVEFLILHFPFLIFHLSFTSSNANDRAQNATTNKWQWEMKNEK